MEFDVDRIGCVITLTISIRSKNQFRRIIDLVFFRMTRNRKYILASYIILFAWLCAVVFIPEFFNNGNTKDYRRWFWVGNQFLSGGNLYDSFYFLYPPFSAFLMALPVKLGKIGFYIALIVVNMISWIAVVELTFKLIGGFQKLKRWQVLLPTILVIPFLSENFHLGQPNVLLFALMLLGFYLLRKAHPILAGISFGASIAIKLFPITVLPYLLWRRHWIASFVAVGSVLFMTFVFPAPIRGFERNAMEVQQWFDGMAGGEEGYGQRTEQNWSWKNQSLIALTHRLVRPLDYRYVEWNAYPGFINIVDVSYENANLIVLFLAGLIGLGFIALIPNYQDRTLRTDNFEFGILLCLMILASPLARNYYFIWLYFPIFILVREASLNESKKFRNRIWIGLGCVVAIGLSTIFDGKKIIQAAGNYFWMTAMIIGMLGMFLLRERRMLKDAWSLKSQIS